MNEWTKRSYEIAQKSGYLDKLYGVFPVILNGDREIDSNVMEYLEKFYTSKDRYNFMKVLISLDTMPVNFPYLTLIKKNAHYLDTNPLIFKIITDHLFSMDFDDIYDKLKKPINGTRQIGPMFKTWVKNGKLGLRIFNDPSIFKKSREDGILDGSDSMLMLYAKENLFYSRDKGLDLIIRVNGKYIVCENKFITDFGGAQNNQFRDAVETASQGLKAECIEKGIYYVALLDGIVYTNEGGIFYNTLKNNDDLLLMSVLVLGDFINSLRY